MAATTGAPEGRPHTHDSIASGWIAAMWLAGFADWAATSVGLATNGAEEANALVAWIYTDTGAIGILALKACSLAALTALARFPRHPLLARVAIGVGILIGVVGALSWVLTTA